MIAWRRLAHVRVAPMRSCLHTLLLASTMVLAACSKNHAVAGDRDLVTLQAKKPAATFSRHKLDFGSLELPEGTPWEMVQTGTRGVRVRNQTTKAIVSVVCDKEKIPPE